MIFLGCSRYIYTATLPVKAGDFGVDFPCAFQPSTRRKEQRLSLPENTNNKKTATIASDVFLFDPQSVVVFFFSSTNVHFKTFSQALAGHFRHGTDQKVPFSQPRKALQLLRALAKSEPMLLSTQQVEISGIWKDFQKKRWLFFFGKGKVTPFLIYTVVFWYPG